MRVVKGLRVNEAGDERHRQKSRRKIMSFIYLWKLDAEKKALLQKAIAPHCSYKKRQQYLDQAEAIQSEIFTRWREGIAHNVARTLGVELKKTD